MRTGNQRNTMIGNDCSLTAAYCPLDLQRECKAFEGPLPRSTSVVHGSAGPPASLAARNFQAPLLLKWCRVDYNKKSNRLEIPKGEYIGKTVYYSRDAEAKREDCEYCDIMANSNLVEIDSQG